MSEKTKQFTLTDFDNQLEMLELLNIQREVIIDLENENRLLNKKITQSEKEKQRIRNIIKEAMQNERTHLGYNALKQLAEHLDIL